MTKIGMLYEEEKREAVKEAVRKAVEEKEKMIEEKEEAVRKAVEEKEEAVREATEKQNILRRLLQGKSVKETAEEFGVSEQKVIELVG